MKTLQFKTNIKCGGCIAKVTPHLNAEKSIAHWQVDLQSPDRVLTVSGEAIRPEQVQQVVRQAGFQASVWNQDLPD